METVTAILFWEFIVAFNPTLNVSAHPPPEFDASSIVISAIIFGQAIR
jgi:hypothetical protein